MNLRKRGASGDERIVRKTSIKHSEEIPGARSPINHPRGKGRTAEKGSVLSCHEEGHDDP